MQRIVADGFQRLTQSPEHQAKLQALRAEIAARYATELSAANFFRRCWIRFQISRELRCEVRRITPSPQSLY